MAQSNSKNEFPLEIETLSYGPYGIGRLEGRVIMIPATAPGDTVRARIVEAKGNYAVGEMVTLVEPSVKRQTPPCQYFDRCGGCSWQHLRYDAQLQAKQRSVDDALRRIGKMAEYELRPIIPSPREFRYRRRIRLQSDKHRRLGFYRALSHEPIEIDSCLIADEPADLQIGNMRRWVGELDTAIGQVEIVAGDEPGELVVIATAEADFNPRDAAVCSGLLAGKPPVSGVIILGRGWRRTFGQPKISVRTEGDTRLQVEADVFTQVNREGNREILQALLWAGEFKGSDRVLELYCGAGNFTLSVAKRVREIVAVEANRAAIDGGKLSAQLNDVQNIRWKCAQVPAAVKELGRRGESFTKIVLDPPRAGAKGIDRDLAALGAQKIFYISCNPATLARDLSALAIQGYKLRMVQPIDLFPHTFHVEALAELTR
ncbi:MAG TPA: 23S rRNA (uracil(1939)-C(5))-methyltransferase RlmD [Candidatus Binatia bacterium]|nr:23S rRNA (uracil(1939)-C(5))-methyltransferase RlmD [Candidatus Binatia bacterium]